MKKIILKLNVQTNNFYKNYINKHENIKEKLIKNPIYNK